MPTMTHSYSLSSSSSSSMSLRHRDRPGNRKQTRVSRTSLPNLRNLRNLRSSSSSTRHQGRNRLGFVASALASLALLTACSPKTASDNGSSNDAITQEHTRGPVTVTLRVEPPEPTFADRIRYTIDVEYEEGVEVIFPEPGEQLAPANESFDPTQFIIRDYLVTPPERTAGGMMRASQSYMLEVVTSGEYTIPSTTVKFIDNRAQNDADTDPPVDGPVPEDTVIATAGKTYEIPTDPVTITVKPLPDTAAIDDLRGIAGPVAPPAVPPTLFWPLVVAGSLAGTALLVVITVKLARRPARPPPPVPPEEIAYRELEWLLEQGFVDRGELREFYFHLSRIVREYIERRFGLRAPERTTEEFLEELARSDRLEARHKELLGRFLEKADLVKFAKYAPASDEITASFEAARDFITETIAETRARRDERSAREETPTEEVAGGAR